MHLHQLFPQLDGLRLEQVDRDDLTLTFTLAARRRTARCPLCGTRSSRVQSRYTRRVADLPVAGHRLILRLCVRRFRCRHRRCPRHIFAERFPALVAAYGRRTHAQRALVADLGARVGGTTGARLATQLGLPASRATVLRLVRAQPLPDRPTPRILGVDDWSQRRGHTYGTLLVDLERHQPIALLPDRTADTLATWLTEHPGVEVISRDRAHAYAEGAARGAPAAVQVADRFHLVQNLGEALLQVLTPHRLAIQRATAAVSCGAASIGEAAPSHPSRGRRPVIVPSLRADPARRAGRLARYQRVTALRAQGWTQAAIAHEVGVSQRTIVRWLAAGIFPERKPRRRPPNPFAPYAEYLTRRWREGCHNATQLWREVCGQGYHGPRYRIWEVVHRLRHGDTAVPDAGGGAALPAPKANPLTPRRVVGLVLRRAEDRSTREQAVLTAVQTVGPEVARACALGSQFLTVLRQRQPDELPAWLRETMTCGLTDLERFASGLERDGDAVRAALTLPYSNGQSEGQITRLKLIKRSMYGRAKLDLLERRVLHRAAA